MARAAKRTSRKSENRRGSPEAVEKRRVARQFNTLLTGGSGTATHRDGRTEKRRARLLKELKDGKSRGGGSLKPLDVIMRVQELLGIGETMGSLRKVVKTKFTTVEGDDAVELLTRLHKAYSFPAEAYRVVGLSNAVLEEAGIVAGPPRPGRRKKA